MRLFWPTAFFSASFCAASDIFASWRFLLHKATVTGTALTCHCVRPTTKGTAGHPQAAAADLHRETSRRWRVSHHRKQTRNTTSTDMGHHPWRKYDAWTDLFRLLFWHFICLKYRNCTVKNVQNNKKNVPNISIFPTHSKKINMAKYSLLYCEFQFFFFAIFFYCKNTFHISRQLKFCILIYFWKSKA